MQRQLRNAIKSKYGVSNKTSSQVIRALAEIEKHRQGTAAGLPGRPGTQQEEQAPTIETIAGGVSSRGYSAQGGILGLIISIIQRLFRPAGSGQAQGGQDVMNILSDLMGGATHPNQAPDLASILLGLLGSSGSTTGSGQQAPDVEGLVTSLLGGQVSPGRERPSRKSK